MNKRLLNLGKYGISNKRYKELCGFCEQYPEWKSAIKNGFTPLKSALNTDGQPHAKYSTSDNTGNLAVKLEEYMSKCNIIENTAKEADAELWQYIINSVCYEVPLSCLIDQQGMPISVASFYDKRRYFFYLLDKAKK